MLFVICNGIQSVEWDNQLTCHISCFVSFVAGCISYEEKLFCCRTFGDNLIYTDWQRDNYFRAVKVVSFVFFGNLDHNYGSCCCFSK